MLSGYFFSRLGKWKGVFAIACVITTGITIVFFGVQLVRIRGEGVIGRWASV